MVSSSFLDNLNLCFAFVCFCICVFSYLCVFVMVSSTHQQLACAPLWSESGKSCPRPPHSWKKVLFHKNDQNSDYCHRNYQNTDHCHQNNNDYCQTNLQPVFPAIVEIHIPKPKCFSVREQSLHHQHQHHHHHHQNRHHHHHHQNHQHQHHHQHLLHL